MLAGTPSKPPVQTSDAALAWSFLSSPPDQNRPVLAPQSPHAKAPDDASAEDFGKSLETLTQKKAAPQREPESKVSNKDTPRSPDCCQPAAEDVQSNPACSPAQDAARSTNPDAKSQLDSETDAALEEPEPVASAEVSDPVTPDAALMDQAASLLIVAPVPLSIVAVPALAAPAIQSSPASQIDVPPTAPAVLDEAMVQVPDQTSPAPGSEPSPQLLDAATPQPDLRWTSDAAEPSTSEEGGVTADTLLSSAENILTPETTDRTELTTRIPASGVFETAKVGPGDDGPSTALEVVPTEEPLEATGEVAPGAEQNLDVERVKPKEGNAHGRAHGMDGAKTTHRMGRADETRHEAPEALQTLPGQSRALPSAASKTGPERPLPEPATPRIFENSVPDRTPLTPGIANGHFSGGVPGLGALGQPGSTSSNPNRVPSIEALQLRITHAVQELRGSQGESMSVVIRPDPRTLLQLNLSMQDGHVAVEARMQRGDFREMSAQWGQLQQSLSLQGIRLNALENGDLGQASPPPAWGHQFGARDHAQQDRPEPGEQETSTNPHSKPAQKSATLAAHGARHPSARRDAWESWA